MKADLHVHTTMSDGSASIDEAVGLAKEAGLDAIAITDHDVLPSPDRDKNVAEKYGVEILRGTEFSSVNPDSGRKVHILCYFPQKTDELASICAETTRRRTEAGIKMTELVCKRFDISPNEVLDVASASASVYKQHILKALMNKGYASEMFGEVFNELFGKNGSCIIGFEKFSTYDIIDAVKASGGVCVMAHPFTYNGIEFLQKALKNNLLNGVEVWSGKTDSEQEEKLASICEGYGVIMTGGSDFHGNFVKKARPIGKKTTPYQYYREIKGFAEKG